MSKKVKLADLLTQVVWPMGQCVRCDIAIRFMGVEHYMATGKIHPLYEKLTLIRTAIVSQDPNARYNPERFPETIKSFRDSRTFDPEIPIFIDPTGRLVEGAHRIACCMFFGIEDIWTEERDVVGGTSPLSWFEGYFTSAEVQSIRDKLDELRDRFVFAPLAAEVEALEYPPNHQYDVKTLAPKGLLVDRLECLRKHAPELMAGDGSLLDVGSNKGYLSIALRDQYTHCVGYEPMPHFVAFANRVCHAHGIMNVYFRVGGLGEITERADVVYAGHFNHHCYAQEVKTGVPAYGFMHQLADLTERFLIVDGPYTLEDATARAVADQGEWTVDQRAAFNLESHAASISNEFDLVRTGPSGTGQRQIAVYKRK